MYSSFGIPQEKGDGTPVTIYDCITDFTSQEIDTQTTDWFCEICEMQREVTVQTSFWVMPNIFTMLLERTDPNDPNYWNDTFIDVPLDDLDLEKYANTQQRDKPLYKLYAVLVKLLFFFPLRHMISFRK